MKKALITGVRGQDGAYLSQLLLAKGYQVYGADRSGAPGLWRLQELGVAGKISEIELDITQQQDINRVLEATHPDEIYNFAAQSFVQASFDNPVLTAEINALGVTRLLEGVRHICPKARFFQASTAELFGSTGSAQQNEANPFHPKSPYGVAKLYAHWITVNYRDVYGLHANNGILFNHESPFRGEEFLTRKISVAAARIKKGLQEKVVVGNLDSRRDWGYAKEYVEAMWLMLQQPKGDDYILASGETHTVREFITAAFSFAGYELRWSGSGAEERGTDAATGKVLVEVSKDFYRSLEVDVLTGDSNKAKGVLGWTPKTKFSELVALMVEADIKRLEVNK